MGILKFYKTPGLKTGQLKSKLHKLSQIEASVINLETELCYYIETIGLLLEEEIRILKWILASPLKNEEKYLQSDSIFNESEDGAIVIEIGPR
jgi:phosphoribosylformylglycinamidine synthase